jgi:hypothetical protein
VSREPAKTFADRLPRLVPKEEPDISHLSDELADILYPGRRPRPFRMGLVFAPFEGKGYDRALELARGADVYRETGSGLDLRHHAAFGTQKAAEMHELYQIVGALPETEILVEGKRVPYACELWLPLFLVFADKRD